MLLNNSSRNNFKHGHTIHTGNRESRQIRALVSNLILKGTLQKTAGINDRMTEKTYISGNFVPPASLEVSEQYSW